MKIITVCGSLRFKKEIMEISEKMELQGNCMLTPIYPTKENKDDYLRNKNYGNISYYSHSSSYCVYL